MDANAPGVRQERRWKDWTIWRALMVATLPWPLVQSAHTRRGLCFLLLNTLALLGYALSYFRSRGSVALKVLFALGSTLGVRYLVAGFRDDEFVLCTIAAGLLIVAFAQSTLTFPHRSLTFRNWRGAVGRTIRRLLGDWRKDDDPFASKIAKEFK